jgi:DNA-binding NtrC family response regulator
LSNYREAAVAPTPSFYSLSHPRSEQIRNLQVLVVEDDEADRASIRRLLQKSDLAVKVVEAASASEALKCLKGDHYHCVLLDYFLPDMDGLKLFETIRAVAPDTPVVICTGRGHEDIAVQFMKAGASDVSGCRRLCATRWI